MTKEIEFKKLKGGKLKIGIVVARWNSEITDALLDQCLEALVDSKVKRKNILVREVPGAFELPFAAQHLIKKEKVDAVICIGVLIKGGTMHFEYIADAVANGIMRVQLNTGVPVIFGVLTCLTEKQALARSVGSKSHGYNWGLSAVEMGLVGK